MSPKKHQAKLYTIRFKNGETLQHQSPLQLAQYRYDARLLTYWMELDTQSILIKPAN